MLFSRLSNYFQQLESVSSRLKITEILAELFKECSANEIAVVCYLSQGKLLPAYEGLEFQMAEKMMVRAVARGVGVEVTEVERVYRSKGDLGSAAEEIKNQSFGFVQNKNAKLFFENKDKKEGLEVLEVYKRLMEIAKDSGEKSVERKIAKIGSLIEDVDSISTRYLVRIPLGKMRMGFSDLTILDALSWMLAGNKSSREQIEKAYEVVADVGEIALIIKKLKVKNQKQNEMLKILKTIKPGVGKPILSALCQRIGTAEEMIEKLGEVDVEPKYDGERLQLHYDKQGIGEKKVRIFTRSLENVTEMFPDIVEAADKEIKAGSAILDGEGVGLDSKSGKYIPFQQTMTRKRKHNIEEKSKEFQLKYFTFDILYKNGKSLMDQPLRERRRILEQTIRVGKKVEGEVILVSPHIVTKNVSELRQYHQEQIDLGLEGVVIKKWHSAYDPGRRGFTWVKFKQEVTKKGGGLVDTIDGIVMGVYRGRGKRASFGVGAFLVGIQGNGTTTKRDQDGNEGSGKILGLTKIGTGLTDEQFKELKKRSKNLEVRIKPDIYDVDKNMTPDVWMKPELVVEIQADNITVSQTYATGYSLRFPRVVRFRDDKSAFQITTLKELVKLYRLQ